MVVSGRHGNRGCHCCEEASMPNCYNPSLSRRARDVFGKPPPTVAVQHEGNGGATFTANPVLTT